MKRHILPGSSRGRDHKGDLGCIKGKRGQRKKTFMVTSNELEGEGHNLLQSTVPDRLRKTTNISLKQMKMEHMQRVTHLVASSSLFSMMRFSTSLPIPVNTRRVLWDYMFPRGRAYRRLSSVTLCHIVNYISLVFPASITLMMEAGSIFNQFLWDYRVRQSASRCIFSKICDLSIARHSSVSDYYLSVVYLMMLFSRIIVNWNGCRRKRS